MKTPRFFLQRSWLMSTGAASVLWLAIAGGAFAQAPRPRSEIRDLAGMFSTGAISSEQKALDQFVERTKIPVVIETIDDLKGETIDVAARRRAERLNAEGIYILSARKDHKLEVMVSKAFADSVPESSRKRIQDTFIAGFRQGDFDKGLSMGIAALDQVHGDRDRDRDRPVVAAEPRESRPSVADEHTSSLVLRNQSRLTLAGAERVVAGARAKAAVMGLKMNIAVVDDGGHMIAFARMDGARPASGYTATTKAVTAATFRAPTGPVPAGTTAPDPLLNLSLQNAALASGGKITTLLGGIPIIVDDQVIGGVGVGGGTGEQDATVARAGVDSFLAEIKK